MVCAGEAPKAIGALFRVALVLLPQIDTTSPIMFSLLWLFLSILVVNTFATDNEISSTSKDVSILSIENDSDQLPMVNEKNNNASSSTGFCDKIESNVVQDDSGKVVNTSLEITSDPLVDFSTEVEKTQTNPKIAEIEDNSMSPFIWPVS